MASRRTSLTFLRRFLGQPNYVSGPARGRGRSAGTDGVHGAGQAGSRGRGRASKATKRPAAARSKKASQAEEPPETQRGAQKNTDKPERQNKKQKTKKNEQEDGDSKEKSTFAPRYIPAAGRNREKWLGLRDAYDNFIGPKLASPSKYEDSKDYCRCSSVP